MGLQRPDPPLLELNLKIGVESLQLLLRQVIDGAPLRLLASMELNSQVLWTVTGHKL